MTWFQTVLLDLKKTYSIDENEKAKFAFLS